VARSMFAADDDTTVKCYGGDDPDSLYRFYYNQILIKLRCLNRHAAFKHDRDEPDDAITLDRLIEESIIKPSSPTLRPDHPKEYQVLARTNNLFYAQYVKEHVCGNDLYSKP
jgi:hypothetical protein